MADGEYFGQEQVPLTDEIREILEEYPDGQIFKEILQNADDAKATEVKFFIDERSHGQYNLLHPSLAKFQGPALLAYNDAVFTDEDWTNIQKLKRSDKRSDPFKVGKFGIGFNSVFHVTDLPAIISGEWLCFMDPQMKIWKPAPGQKYKLTANKPRCRDSFAPFQFSHHCSLKPCQDYDGTIIRFPLRKESSELSDKLYSVANLNTLLLALKDDAAILLLFLRHVEKIEVFTINTSNTVSKIFSVEMDESTEYNRRKLKTKFLKDVTAYHSNPRSKLPHLQYETTVTVHDFQTRKQLDYQWLVIHWVGSRDKDVMEASSKVCSLPWIGFAVPLTLQCPSRLFCFLPLPDSKEVNPPLPVCVHGTFGLNKDRRHLKWITSDMKNDAGALWNNLLLLKMLPSCYVDCLNVLKEKCNSEAFYFFWPNTSTIRKTNWKIGLNALLSLLLQGQYFWSENGRWVGLDSSVCVVPQVNSSRFPKVVIDVLIRCGKTVVVLPDDVWDAVKFIHGSFYPFTTITSPVVRKALKSNPRSYVNLSRVEKFQLLHFCLEDGKYSNAIGLRLLPTLNDTFVTFEANNSWEKMYLCKQKFAETKLLSNYNSVIVSLEAEDEGLHTKLNQLAENGCTQLQVMNLNTVATLLKQTPPFKNGWCLHGSAGGFYNDSWLRRFWRWVSKYDLSHFEGISLIPICNEKTVNAFRVMPLLKKSNSNVLKFSSNISSIRFGHTSLVSAAGKLDCYLTSANDFEFLYHAELNNYICELSSSCLLTISSQSNYQSVVFTQEEAVALREFLFQYYIDLNIAQKSVLLYLQIFSTIQKGTLYSVQQAKSRVAGKSTTLLIAEPEYLDKYLSFIPPSPVILTCVTSIVDNVQYMLQGACWVPTKLQLITHVILTAIESKQFTRNRILKVTSILSEPGEFYSLAGGQGGSLFISKLKSMKFVPVGQRNDLVLPCEVYNPADRMVKDLFDGQSVFPISPFSRNHYSILQQLGMKDCTSLCASDIIRVANLVINNDGGVQAEVKRACKLLEFLASSTGNKLLNEYYNYCPLDETLCSLQWLPVITTPPKGYPKCLGWKGSSGSQFVSAQSLHTSSSPEEQTKLPNLIGSQMKILQYDDPLPVKLIASLNIPQSVPVDAMILQFLKLIKHKTEIERQKMNETVKLLYSYLQQAADNNRTSQYWRQLRQSEVVQVSDNKFVLPSVVACSFDEKCMTVGKLEPYWYILPSDLQQYRSLFCFIGATDTITVSDILYIFERITSTGNAKTRDLPLVKKILQWLCNKFTSDELMKMLERIFVPVNNDDENKLVLKPADKVAFLNEDLQWLKDVKEALGSIAQGYFLVHPFINYNMCCALQLKPLNTMIANTEEFCFKQAGQSEPLTTRLNRILREYRDTSVIQELLQNADDAGATEVAIYYDTREHDSSHLFFPGMANSYGPALLFYNNAEFSEEDFENIRKIAGETKINKPLKIGKFGIGFCSVYHFTDVPSFVSGDSLVIFDPTLHCLRKEIKSEFNPGIKINFNQHFLLKKSNQLNPYMGIGGFNPKKPFHGTLFRFPLRLSSSDISKSVYTKAKVQSMVNRVKENSSKLLMFLNSVKKVSFYQSHGDGFNKHFEITVAKKSIYNSISCQVSVTTILPSSKHKEEKWLIASDAQQLVIGPKEQNHGTASVSVKLTTDSTSNKIRVGTIKGECFCFLPLNIETGLPVHVSSNFAVTTNRRGIWKADDVGTATKETNWNKLLMESVVAQAYIKLLLSLQQMQQDGSLVDYTFHSLWPISLNEINPWDFLVNKVYMITFSSQHSLFYSEVMSCWKKLNECNFLSKSILQIGFSNDLYESIYHVAATLKLPVVHLPDKLLDKHKDNLMFNSRIIGEGEFIRNFYQDKTLSMVSVQDKTEIVAASLIVFANNRHTKAMPALMKNTNCIPCSPDGKIFKKPQELLDPNSKIAQLFSLDNGVFPDQNFLSRHYLLTISLNSLGLMASLSWELVIDRAWCVEEWYNENTKEALKRLVILVECIKDNSSEYLPQKSVTHELQQIPFLPTMKKPEIYPIKWKADTMSQLLSGPELLKTSYNENSINAVYACGSQVAILDTHYLSPHFTSNVQKILGITQEIDVIHVVGQFNELLQWFQGISSDLLSKELLECTNIITLTVYDFLSTKLKSMKDNDLLQKHLLPLKDQPCIWNGKRFLTPACVCFNWEMSGPYLYKFPELLEPFVDLMEYFGIENDFSAIVMLNALHEMKSKYGNNKLPKNLRAVVRHILPKLSDHEIQSDTEIFLPDNEFVLRSIKELKYNDAPWCDPSEEYVYCHECVERTVAIHLDVELVKNILLEDLDVTSNDLLLLGKEFGQQEKLTQRLNNILRDYPSDITFLKELLQNADDAGATQLFIILDKRFHDNEKVISDEWKPLQGPALLFWNNSSFSDEDLLGIQKIGLGSKRDDADKIGQYGIGFNVVYHFTDCPSFVTNDRLCIMDPHYRYIAPKRMKPGWMFQDLETLWNRFPDMKSPYLLNELDDLPAEMKEGSLFRLPLRLTVEEAEQSEIVENSGFFELDKLESDLKSWVPEMREALLFVHHNQVMQAQLELYHGMILSRLFFAAMLKVLKVKRT
ncbi:sacsin-like [Dysidea avara]|uniref:sacsin-like n=1 Tax=Dysidea avara TaxID=196820 RepID=UPI0033207FC7